MTFWRIHGHCLSMSSALSITTAASIQVWVTTYISLCKAEHHHIIWKQEGLHQPLALDRSLHTLQNYMKPLFPRNTRSQRLFRSSPICSKTHAGLTKMVLVHSFQKLRHGENRRTSLQKVSRVCLHRPLSDRRETHVICWNRMLDC